MLKLDTVGKIVGPVGGVLILASGMTLMMVTRGEWSWQVWVPLALGLVFVGLFAKATWSTIRNRGTVYSSLSVVSTAALLAALVAVNYIAAKKETSWDLTRNQIFTLADQTRTTLETLAEPIRISAYYRSDEPGYEQLDSLLRRYKEVAGDKLDFEFVDMYKQPERVQASNITQNGPRILVSSKSGKEARAKEPSEEAVTNAITEVVGGPGKKIYFTEGHGEKSIEDDQERGLKNFAEGLRAEGYKLDKLTLLSVTEIPADAQVVILAGPSAPLLPKEAELLKGWAEKGGKILALLDPGAPSGLEDALKTWGVDVKATTVIDTESQYPQWAIAQRYEKHAITTPRASPFAVAAVFPLARTIHKLDAAGFTVTELAFTGAKAWGETGSLAGGTVAFEPGQDVQGPVPLAVATSKTVGTEEQRVAVFGDSDFAGNANLKVLGNKDLAMNSVAWLAQQEAKISIRPKSRDASRLFLSAEQRNNIAFGSFIMAPVLLLAAGLVVWQIRKNK